MNEHDRSNYDYIMRLSDEEFADWMDQASDDDLEYAQELIRIRRVEILEQTLDFEDKLASLDYSQAEKLLKRYML